jgi:hypothetical protein
MVARETVTPVPVTGRRIRRREKYTYRTMRRALLWGGLFAAFLLAYTIPFAGAAQEGYHQNQIKLQIQQLNRDNEYLNTVAARLRNPQRVEAYAVKSGMVMRQGALFVTLKPEKTAAPAPKPLLARLASLSLR